MLNFNFSKLMAYADSSIKLAEINKKIAKSNKLFNFCNNIPIIKKWIMYIGIGLTITTSASALVAGYVKTSKLEKYYFNESGIYQQEYADYKSEQYALEEELEELKADYESKKISYNEFATRRDELLKKIEAYLLKDDEIKTLLKTSTKNPIILEKNSKIKNELYFHLILSAAILAGSGLATGLTYLLKNNLNKYSEKLKNKAIFEKKKLIRNMDEMTF